MGTRRVALKPHAEKIRRWVDEGHDDDWIAQELNTTSSSVQSFRSRNSIYRRDPVRRGQLSEHPVILEEAKLADDQSGLVLRTDAAGSDVFRSEWQKHLDGPPENLRIVVTRERIYLEKTASP